MARLNLFLWLFLFILVNAGTLMILAQRPYLRQELRMLLQPVSITIDGNEVRENTIPRQPIAPMIFNESSDLWHNEDFLESTRYGDIPSRNAAGEPAYTAYRGEINATSLPQLSIVILNAGFDSQAHSWALSLPSAVSMVYSPYVIDLTAKVALARGSGHEVLLDMPVSQASANGIVDRGPLELDFADMASLQPRFYSVLAQTTGYVGLRGDLGEYASQNTSDVRDMLEDIKKRGLLYLDYEPAKGRGLNRKFGESLISPSSFMILDSSLIGIDDYDTAFQKAKQLLASGSRPLLWVVPSNRALLIALYDDLAENNKTFTLLPFSHLVK